jgi:hypothetical protein
MRTTLQKLLAGLAFLLVGGVHAQVGVTPNLSVTNIVVTCQGLQPYVTFTLPIEAPDQGRPGLLYIGMHDPSMSQADLLTTNGWMGYAGGMLPVYSVARAGLTPVTITLPLPPVLAGGGWSLYAGYGALSASAESQVEAAITAVNDARALGASGVIASVDPDHYRRSLIQGDMTQNGKYGYVHTGVETNPYVCQPQLGGGGN